MENTITLTPRLVSALRLNLSRVLMENVSAVYCQNILINKPKDAKAVPMDQYIIYSKKVVYLAHQIDL